MARAKKKEFNATGPFVARVAFPFNGKMFTAGEYFPHSDIEFRKLRILYDSRKIEFFDTEDVAVSKSPIFDWRELDAEALMVYAFEQTGTRFRKVERAVKALEDVC